MPDGVLLQELPFDIELKKFIVDYYATGMPKLFASEIVIHDHDTGAGRCRRRSRSTSRRSTAASRSTSRSFDDGGSQRQAAGRADRRRQALRGRGRASAAAPSSPSGPARDKMTLEFTGLRVINVENFGGAPGSEHRPTCARSTSSARSRQRLGSRRTRPSEREGAAQRRPVSVSYKLRDASGPGARVQQLHAAGRAGDGSASSSLGVRDNPAEPFRYLRIPADEQRRHGRLVRLRAALADPAAARARRSRRYVALATPSRQAASWPSSCTPRPARALALFAGAEPRQGRRGQPPAGCRRIVRLHRGQRARGRARAHLARCCCASSTAAVRAAQPDARAGRPGAARARREDAGLHDAGGAVALRQLLLSGAGAARAGRLQAGAGQRVPGRARAGQDAGLSGRATCSSSASLPCSTSGNAGSGSGSQATRARRHARHHRACRQPARRWTATPNSNA